MRTKTALVLLMAEGHGIGKFLECHLNDVIKSES